jgi:dTDP-4-amino-4,6-dideoxy-D-galactose acyltransferase
MTTSPQHPPCEFLEWDTQFFGKRIGSIQVNTLNAETMQEIMQWSQEMAIECLYFLANTEDAQTIRIAETNGFYFQSVRTVVERPLSNLESLDLPAMEGLTLRSAKESDLELLRPVARHSYNWTRFSIDPCFPDNKAEEMYDIWLTKSVRREMADEVVVAEYGGQAVGYMTCRLAKDGSTEGTFQLLGVAGRERHAKS